MRIAIHLALGSFAVFRPSAAALIARNKTAMVYDFDHIPASKDLQWAPCFEGFECTKLSMPLDYSDLSAGTTDIAWIKQDAPNANSSTPDILLNPGGPGDSGVEWLVEAANALRERLGPDHTIVSFDPRGVNNSGPTISCFGEDRANEYMYNAEVFRPTDLDLNDQTAVMKQWQMADGYGEWCTKALQDGPAKHANTVGVVGDMFHFLALRANEAGKSDVERTNVKLRFYGQSYGSVLGMTAALLHPDRIERMILDGIHNPVWYFKGLWPAKIVEQADAAVQQFFTGCHEAGPERCLMYDETPEKIKERVGQMLDDVAQTPISFADANVVHMPQVLTVGEMKSLLAQAAYDPLMYFPRVDRILAELEKGNATSFAWSERGDVDAGCRKDKQYKKLQTTMSITAVDADGRTRFQDVGEFVMLRRWMNRVSRFGANLFGFNSLLLRSFNVKPPASQVFSPVLPAAKKTLTPILFATNTIDVVTPYSNAVEMSQMFEGAGLVVQNSSSHATNKWPSKYSDRYFQQYLRDGSLPPRGTVCQVEARVFFDEPYR